MPRLPVIVLSICCLVLALSTVNAATNSAPTALVAVKLLPKGAGAQLALIAGYEGQPVPERWHLLIYDPKEESGLREYVVAKGTLGTSYSVSQFASKLGPDDVIGAQNVKIDSDRAAKLAKEYAKVNKMTVSAYNYELRKEEPQGEPMWHITCLNADGQTLGTLVLLALKGTVVAHEGFELEPPSGASGDKLPAVASLAGGNSGVPQAGAVAAAASTSATLPTPRTAESGSAAPATPPARTPKSEIRTAAAEPRRTPPPSTPKPKPAPVAIAVATPIPVATPLPVEPPEEQKRPGFFRRAGGSVRNIFGGRSRDAD